MEQNEATVEFRETVIIGAGPAGCQLAFYLERAGRDYVVLERNGVAGSFFKTFPRHRKLISINKVYTGYDDPALNLRWDWNSLLSDDDSLRLPRFSKRYFPDPDDFVRYMHAFAEETGIEIRYQVEVSRVRRRDGGFALDLSNGTTLRCERLVVATGLHQPYVPPIEGIEHVDHYTTMSVDPDEYINQRVLILGKGNSAFETADALMETTAAIHLVSPTPIKMAWQTHFVGHLRAVNNNLLDTYQLKLQNAVLDARVERIERVGDEYEVTFAYCHAHGEVEKLRYDRVLCCAGFRFDDRMFEPDCRPASAIDGRFPDQTCEWESSNVPNLYFAGTLTQARDYKRSMSAFIHGFRYNARVLHRIMERKHHGVPLPHRELRATPKALTAEIVRRINSTSALWQMPGFLADFVSISEGGVATYHEGLPLDYILEGRLDDAARGFAITLEYGDSTDFDPFRSERVHRDDASRAEQSKFLHPVVRELRGGRFVATHHVIEDLAAEWREPVHVDPLHAFLEQRLVERAMPSRSFPRAAAASGSAC